MADAVEAVVGSLEIIDSRIAEWRITLPDTIADNASYGAVIVGGFRVPLSTIEVTTLPVSLAVNGEVVARATGAAVMGSPLRAVAWLANRLGELDVSLQPGRVVLPGSVCPAAPVADGDTVTAEFGDLGVVEVSFSASEAGK